MVPSVVNGESVITLASIERLRSLRARQGVRKRYRAVARCERCGKPFVSAKWCDDCQMHIAQWIQRGYTPVGGHER